MKGSAASAVSIAMMALLATSSDAKHHKHHKSNSTASPPWPFLEDANTTTVAPPVFTTLSPINDTTPTPTIPETTVQPVVSTSTPTVIPTTTPPRPTTSVPPPSTAPPTTPTPATSPPPTTATPTTIPPTAAPVTTPRVTTQPPTAAPTTTTAPTTTPVETVVPSTTPATTNTPLPTTPALDTPSPSPDVTPPPPVSTPLETTPTPSMGVASSGPPSTTDDRSKAKNETAGKATDETGMTNMQLLAIGGGALCLMVLVMVFVVARRRRNFSDSKEDSLHQWTDSAFHTSRQNPLLHQQATGTLSQHPRAMDTLEMLHTLHTEKHGKSVRFASESNHHRMLNSMDSNILNDHEEEDEDRLSETPRLSSSWSIGTTELCIPREDEDASRNLWTAIDQPLEDIDETSVDDELSSAGSSTGVSLTFSPSSEGTYESWGSNSSRSFVSIEHPPHDFVSTSSSLESNDLMESSRYLDMIRTNVHVAEDV